MSDEGKKRTFLETTSLSEDDLAKIRALKRARQQEGQVSLLIYSRDGVQVVPLIEGQSAVIGRAPPADVTVRDNSLSRQHACVELEQGEVWVEDLQSTNGTWVDGERVERAKVEAGSELVFGVVTASVHALAPMEIRQLGLESHDRFQMDLDAEVSRARTFGRSLALLMLKAGKDKASHVSRWFPDVRLHLRPFDRMALYSSNTVEILLPEATFDQAAELAEAMVKGGGLLCGLGVLPEHAASSEELLDVTRTALQRATARAPVKTPVPAAPGEAVETVEVAGEGLVVQSAAMQEVYKTVERLASSAIPVLIVGETGTGKEVVARGIHGGGKRKNKPILCVNCGGIPPNLVESTLFGHEKGAFTGAEKQARGVFESANGGTVLLDEIGELPPLAQASLLRVLETKRFTRVGANKEIEVDVRILAATHKDLEGMVKSGDFREDLFYRLNAMTLKIPPLRDRPEEIEALALHFMKLANRANDTRVERIEDDAVDLLKRYAWPGNVRELRNAIERAVVIAQENVITVEDLPERVRELEPVTRASEHGGGEERASGLPDGSDEINLKAELQRIEAELILQALRKTSWDRQSAARRLGLPLRTLAHKMQVHGIKKVSYEKS